MTTYRCRLKSFLNMEQYFLCDEMTLIPLVMLKLISSLLTPFAFLFNVNVFCHGILSQIVAALNFIFFPKTFSTFDDGDFYGCSVSCNTPCTKFFHSCERETNIRCNSSVHVQNRRYRSRDSNHKCPIRCYGLILLSSFESILMFFCRSSRKSSSMAERLHSARAPYLDWILMALSRFQIHFLYQRSQKKRIELRNLRPKVSFCTGFQEYLSNPCSAKYQRSVISALKEVQGDENIVGFYQTTSVPLRQSLVESQAYDNERLRHGGIVILHGMFYMLPSCSGC